MDTAANIITLFELSDEQRGDAFKWLLNRFNKILQHPHQRKHHRINPEKHEYAKHSMIKPLLWNAGFTKTDDWDRIIFDINKLNDLNFVYDNLLEFASVYVDKKSYFDSTRFIDDKSIVIDGYIRRYQSLLSLNSMSYNRYLPSLVNDIILMYIITNQWDTVNKGWNITLDDSDRLIYHCGQHKYGNIFSKSLMSRNIHHWQFRIELINNAYYNTLGIIEYDKNLTTDDLNVWDNAYGLIISHEKLKNMDKIYCAECNNGDTIEMIVDLKEMELRYVINNIDYGITFELKRSKYKLCLSIGGTGKWRLLSYHMTV